MEIIQNSTPRITFFLVSDTDHDVDIIGASPTVTIGKNGAAHAAITNSVYEVGNGEYYFDLTALETDTLGPLNVRATATNAAVWREVHTVIANPVTAADDPWTGLLANYTDVGTAGYTLNKLNAFAELTELNILSIIVGGVINVHRFDSWVIPISGLPDLSGYTSIVFSVKESEQTDDLRAQLLVRSDTGLLTVGGQAAAQSSNGDVVIGTNAITVVVKIAETSKAWDGDYTWWVKAFDSVAGTGETIATGEFIIGTSGAEVTS